MKQSKANRIKAVVFVPVFHSVIMAFFFLLAGRFDFPFVWIYFALQIVNSLVIIVFISDDLLAERLSRKKDIKPWDLFFNRAYVAAGIIIYVIAGLDARFGLSPLVPDGAKIACIAIALAAGIFADWAVFSNPYFSRFVRIQSDRGQKPVQSGPYAFVRHPAYMSACIALLLLPVILGSLWAFLPAVSCVSLMVWRTLMEDGTLKKELPGYAEYADKVKYRLLPGIF